MSDPATAPDTPHVPPHVPPHVTVTNLRIAARGPDGQDIVIVDDVSFAIPKGEVLALIGESGSGKTTIALSLLGHVRPGAAITGGSITVGDAAIRSLTPAALRDLRGNRIAYVAQSAASAFNPSRTLMDQVVEPALIHDLLPRPAAEAKAVELFRALGLPKPDTIGQRYPHQLSGGQLQRLMAAMALITDPELVILDEPTTALDVTTQIGVLQAFRAVVRDRGTTAVYVSHDLAVVAQMADHIVVLNRGRVRETGRVHQILQSPRDDYTKTLMAAAHPVVEAAQDKPRTAPVPLLQIEGLTAGYGRVDAQGRPAVPVLRDIGLTLHRGEILGVIGESGSGKSTLARVIAGLLPPARGRISLDGAPLAPGLDGRSRDDFRRVQIVFQNADVALNPAHSVGQILKRPLAFYHGLTGAAADARVAELLERIQLPRTLADRPCTDLSGGQKQRVNLARALAAGPDLILCDEVTSALDTVVGAAILDLLADLRRELGIAMVFISHDISTVRAICDDILVLYSGDVVDQGPRAAFGSPPHHPYTDLLIRSVPEMRPGWLPEGLGAPALPPIDPLAGDADLCRFLPRCNVRVAGLCDRIAPPRHDLAAGNAILCHLEEGPLAVAQRAEALV
ncbi:ABC transporter ATP-binding protein [Sphingobium sufflavum]|uniref:ABC transporter ATP-binding protein n=1 Tax=Sphingobium sufflavum TaxID=1129547 RepID=UPI001F1B0E1E|nr:ABC transporter ATP-binding protein [Sphingobium sufflavum]MCE7796288.1 ABC transporter ATP-binding protein [Sphingobium sufflavum]